MWVLSFINSKIFSIYRIRIFLFRSPLKVLLCKLFSTINPFSVFFESTTIDFVILFFCSLSFSAKKRLEILFVHFHMAICKPRHWNLSTGIGIGNGIGIGTDITNAIISSSIRPMAPRLSRAVLRMRRPHPESHVTLRYCGQAVNEKRYIFTFTRPMNPKLSRVVT